MSDEQSRNVTSIFSRTGRPLIVAKFGGTSLATTSHIQSIARQITDAVDMGRQLIVVVSAMAGETDNLMSKAGQVALEPNLQTLDFIVSSGEQISAGLLALALENLGFKAKPFTAFQAGIVTDNQFGDANIVKVEKQHIQRSLDRNEIPVVTGFQGVTENGDVTTLGRGGSDTTAMALAAAFSADLCEICTDVDGVYSSDPNQFRDALKFSHLDYDQMGDIVNRSARVLHSKSLKIAKETNVPILIRSSFTDVEGTMISKNNKGKGVEI